MRQRRPRVLLLIVAGAIALPAGAAAEQASQPLSPAAGQLSAGKHHSCVVLSAAVRCWGFGGDGRLGYANVASIGDDETPGSVGPVDLGAGATVRAISSGEGHTCALAGDGSVRCWGFGGNGRLGYGSVSNVGDDESPGSLLPVDLGAGHTAKAISAGGSHTCAVLDDDTLRCWGWGLNGSLGYGNDTDIPDNDIDEPPPDIGDDEAPGSLGPVNIGAGQTAAAISAGDFHTCALLTGGAVRCWGFGGRGQLGYGNGDRIGDDEVPGSVGPVPLGLPATAISAGGAHTCALLQNGGVRCWGAGDSGQLGYGNTSTIGVAQTPDAVGPVDLGTGRTATSISAGGAHTCALLDDASVRCWGANDFGQLGYANATAVGDDEPPGSVGPVDLGPGRGALAISAGDLHTCALLDDVSVRCWGYGSNGRLGTCGQASVGDDELPSAVGPVDLGGSGAGCAAPPPGPGPAGPPGPGVSAPPPPAAAAPPVPADDPLAAQTARARRLRSCLRAADRRPRRVRKSARAACLKRHGRTPGAIARVTARAVARSRVALTFTAPGSDGRKAPAARGYLVKQSERPIRGARDFARAQALCTGTCRFDVTAVGTKLNLTVTDLRPGRTYYYAVAARDNVSNRTGPRSPAVRIRLRR